MKLFFIILGLCLLCFLGMVLYLYLNQRKILYYPQPLDRSWPHVQENVAYEYQFVNEGVTLRGWLLQPDCKRLLIYYGGNGEEASQLIDLYKNLSDVAILLVNYRGYGESEGSPTEKDMVADAVAIFDDVEDRYDSIVLLGRSLGSGVAVQVASQRKVDHLILVTPYDSIAAVGQGMYPWAPVRLLSKDPFDSLQASKKVEEPALFLVAEVDRIVPVKHAKNLYDHWQGSKEWISIQGSDHNSITEIPIYWDLIDRYLNDSPQTENL